jgi:hypothetical protein
MHIFSNTLKGTMIEEKQYFNFDMCEEWTSGSGTWSVSCLYSSIFVSLIMCPSLPLHQAIDACKAPSKASPSPHDHSPAITKMPLERFTEVLGSRPWEKFNSTSQRNGDTLRKWSRSIRAWWVKGYRDWGERSRVYHLCILSVPRFSSFSFFCLVLLSQYT